MPLPTWLGQGLGVLGDIFGGRGRGTGAGGNLNDILRSPGWNPTSLWPFGGGGGGGSGGGGGGGGTQTTGGAPPGGDWDWLMSLLHGGANVFGTYMSAKERKELQDYIKKRIDVMDKRAGQREEERTFLAGQALPNLIYGSNYGGRGDQRELIARKMWNSPFMKDRRNPPINSTGSGE